MHSVYVDAFFIYPSCIVMKFVSFLKFSLFWISFLRSTFWLDFSWVIFYGLPMHIPHIIYWFSWGGTPKSNVAILTYTLLSWTTFYIWRAQMVCFVCLRHICFMTLSQHINSLPFLIQSASPRHSSGVYIQCWSCLIWDTWDKYSFSE